MAEVGAGPVELLHLALLLAEGPHHPHAGEVLLQNRAHAALRLIAVAEVLVHHLEEPHGEQEQRRHQDHADEGDLHAAAQQDRQGDDHHQHRVDHLHHLHGEEAADGVHIGGAALDQVAGFGLGMVGKGQVLQVGIELFAQREGDVLAGHGVQAALQVGEYAAYEVQGHQHQAQDPQMIHQELPSAQGPDGPEHELRQGGGMGAQHAVDGFRQQDGRQEADQHNHRRGDHRPDITGQVLPHQRQHGLERLLRLGRRGLHKDCFLLCRGVR